MINHEPRRGEASGFARLVASLVLAALLFLRGLGQTPPPRGGAPTPSGRAASVAGPGRKPRLCAFVESPQTWLLR